MTQPRTYSHAEALANGIIGVRMLGQIILWLFGVAIIMGRRLSSFSVKAGGLAGSAKASTPGASVDRNKVEGDFNTAKAEGDNASIAGNTIKGSGNEFGAKSGRA